MRGNTKNKVHIGHLLDDQDNQITSLNDITESFNNYFSSVFTAEDTSNIQFPSSMTPGSAAESLHDIMFTEQDVIKVLSRLRSDKAAGADDLSPRFLLEIKEFIAHPLYLLFRKSLDEGVVPQDWKCANITPIYKKGSRSRAENYRPVSLTSQISKVFETLIRDAMVQYLETNSIISDSQHGFRKGRSCLTNILTFLDRVTGCVDSGEDVDGLC